EHQDERDFDQAVSPPPAREGDIQLSHLINPTLCRTPRSSSCSASSDARNVLPVSKALVHWFFCNSAFHASESTNLRSASCQYATASAGMLGGANRPRHSGKTTSYPCSLNVGKSFIRSLARSAALTPR